MDRTVASKVCYVLAAILFLLAVFSVSVGTLSLVPAGLVFVAAGLAIA